MSELEKHLKDLTITSKSYLELLNEMTTLPGLKHNVYIIRSILLLNDLLYHIELSYQNVDELYHDELLKYDMEAVLQCGTSLQEIDSEMERILNRTLYIEHHIKIKSLMNTMQNILSSMVREVALMFDSKETLFILNPAIRQLSYYGLYQKSIQKN